MLDLSGATPTISIRREAGQVAVHFTGQLQSAGKVEGPYTNVPVTSPYLQPVAGIPRQFWRSGMAGTDGAESQPVYSTNAVGFVNVVMPPGLTIIANQLNTPSNRMGSLFQLPPPGFTVYKFNGTSYSINAFELPPFGGGSGEFNDPEESLNPGEAAWVNNPLRTPYTNTFVGEVLQGTFNIPLPRGLTLVASPVPREGLVQSQLEFPAVAGDRVYLRVGGYVISAYEAPPGGLPPEWDDEPFINAGRGFFVRKVAATNWILNFRINAP